MDIAHLGRCYTRENNFWFQFILWIYFHEYLCFFFFKSWLFIWTSCFQPSVWLNSIYIFFFFSYKPLHFMRLLYGKTMLCSGHTYPKCSHRREIGLDPCEINPTQHCEAYSTSGMNEEPWEPWVFATLFHAFLPCTFWSVLLEDLVCPWFPGLCALPQYCSSFTSHLLLLLWMQVSLP